MNRQEVEHLVEKYDDTYKECRDKKGVVSDWMELSSIKEVEDWLQAGVIEGEYAGWMQEEGISAAEYFKFATELLECAELDIYLYAPANVARAIHMWHDGKLGGDIMEEVIKGTFEISRWKGESNEQ